MIDTREPENGDFVAYVERIEREQLERAMRPHKLQQLTADGKTAAEDRALPLTAAEAQRVRDRLKAQGKTGSTPLGPLIGAVIGGGLLMFGLIAEGGMFLVLLGAFLLWHNLRRLISLRRAVPPPSKQVEAAFGRGQRNAGRGS
jgi:hypothetical protein